MSTHDYTAGGNVMRSVGVREFRAQLATFIDSGEAVEINRHGETVGVFLPTNKPQRRSPEAFLRAAEALDQQLAELGIDPEELIAEFEQLRRPNR
jgi:antitoxin (DNA-binding transcriptional repressor) of toxin-antitoxin stability system